jgi:hypothetical protein
MNTLLVLRSALRQAEIEYAKASSSMDGSSTALIIAKQVLKEARFEYAQICQDYVEECIAAEAVLKSDEARLWRDAP